MYIIHPTPEAFCFDIPITNFPGKKKRSKVYLEITADGEDVGRIEIELFDDIVPRTAENFRWV